MSTLSTFGGPLGWGIGGMYFFVDVVIGWKNAIPSYISVEKNKENMRDLNIMRHGDFKFQP